MELTRYANIEAEQNILGAILKDSDKIIDVIDKLDSKDFYNGKHALIYNAMLNLYKDSKKIDVTTLYEQLGKNITEIGGITYLSELMGSALSNIAEYVEIVKEKANMRNLKTLLDKSLNDLNNSNKKSQDIINNLQNTSLDMATGESKIVDDSNLMTKTLELIEKNYNNQGEVLGYRTGIGSLDKALNGLQGGKLYIVAGRPGMAKSAFALNLAQKASEDKNVLYYSLEMGEEELGIRRLAMKARIDSIRIERGKLEDKEWEHIARVASLLSNYKCKTNCAAGVHINTIRAECKKMSIQQGLDALFIDYIGIMALKDMGDTLREQIGNVCVQLKNLAKEFNIPVVALSQVSRGCEARADKRPMLSDLKESGGVEENADVVMLLYRDEYYNPDTDLKNILEVDIAKQRGGRTGRISLAWEPQYQNVGELAETWR